MTHRDLTKSSVPAAPKRLYLIGVILPTVCIALVGLCATVKGAPPAVAPGHPHGSGVYAATEAPGVEICFPAAAWDAYAEDRPCDLLGRPQEDGSSTLRLGTLGADAAVCIIPNPYEERGRFTIQCHRVANR